MKIKSASFIALISVCAILLSQFLYFTFSFIHFLGSRLVLWYKASEVLFELGWIGILVFFVALYKKSVKIGAASTRRATLFALASVCVMVLCDTINTALYLADVQGSRGLMVLTTVTNVIWPLAWIGIIFFFKSLYNRTQATTINTPTLVALISSCVLALRALANISINIIQYATGPGSMNALAWYKTSAVLGLLGWVGMLIFFVALYNHQK